MCGIVGYIGDKEAVEELMKGLKKLEYRGYDSAGISIAVDHQLKTRKTKGRLADLEKKIEYEEMQGTTGIGHTRWATHGKPSDINAHPHVDGEHQVSVVHNGIIENFQTLKSELKTEGYKFDSETDTEVIAHLLSREYQGDLKQTMFQVTEKLKGSFALAVLHQDEPGKIVCARKDSPLIVGLGEGEQIIASDIPAILDYTRKTLVLEDGEIAEITKEQVKVFDAQGNEVEKEPFEINWDAKEAEKGGYEHFMLKEIHEQPAAVKETIRSRINDGRVCLENIHMEDEQLKELEKIHVVACGTAYHAGLVGKTLIENIAGISVDVEIASEFRYKTLLLDSRDLVIVISQSGETADTLAALRESQKKEARVLAITNVVGSSVSREADGVIYTWAGPEIAVASTKAYVTQLVSLALVALHLARGKGTLTDHEQSELVSELEKLPQLLEETFQREEDIKKIAQWISPQEHAFFIGRQLDWAVAEEGALKLKEISYIHAEAYPAGELKHGTLALVTDGIPIFALATQPHVYEKLESNLQEVKARGGCCITVVYEGDKRISENSDYVMHIPRVNALLSPILSVIPLQLLAYYAAVARGTDVDKPRNLAKSVTVE